MFFDRYFPPLYIVIRPPIAHNYRNHGLNMVGEKEPRYPPVIPSSLGEVPNDLYSPFKVSHFILFPS